MAIERTGGLDAVEAPSTVDNAVQGAAQEYTSGIPVTSNIKGSPINVGKTNLGPTQTAELLANMQEMIAQKTGGWNQFMGGLKDAAAWAVPGLHGQKQLALASRDEAKRQEMQDVFNMRSQMASLKSAQAQAENTGKQLDALVSGGGAGGAGGTSEAIPDSVLQRIAALRARGDNAGAAAAYDDYLKTKTNERIKLESQPGYFEQKPYDTGRGVFMMNVPQIEEFRRSGRIPDEVNAPGLQGAAKGAPQLTGGYKGVAADVNNPTGMRSNGGFDTFDTPQAGVAADLQKSMRYLSGEGPMKGVPATPENVVGMWVTGDPKQGADIQGGRYVGRVLKELKDANVKLNPDGTIPATPEAAAAISRAKIVHEAGKNADRFLPYATVDNVAQKPMQVASASTGTMTDAQPPVRRPGESVDAFKQRQKLWEKQSETNIDTAATSGVESRKKAGDMIAAIEQNAKNADEVIRTADRVIQHATKHPKEFGYGYQQENPILAGAANIPGVGPIVEKVVPAVFGSKGESSRRATTATDASKLGLDFAAQMFSGTGARLGVGLEQMAANAKGVGPDLPAATNALNANLVKVAAEKSHEQAAAWREWRATHGGDNADPYQFMQSAQNKAIVKKYNDKLDSFEGEARKIYPEYFGPKEAPKKNRKALGDILGGNQ